ncbi:hypothetical protein FQZ97_996390 [compost metagenome]
MNLVEQLHCDVDTVVVDAHGAGQVLDQAGSGEIIVFEDPAIVGPARHKPTLFDPDFEYRNLDFEVFAKLAIVHALPPRFLRGSSILPAAQPSTKAASDGSACGASVIFSVT